MGGQAGRDDGKGYGGRDHRQRVMMPGTEYNDMITVYLFCGYSVFTCLLLSLYFVITESLHCYFMLMIV